MRFLLDGLHEDLNRVRRKPAYEELKSVKGESLQDEATRWWKSAARGGILVPGGVSAPSRRYSSYCHGVLAFCKVGGVWIWLELKSVKGESFQDEATRWWRPGCERWLWPLPRPYLLRPHTEIL